MSPRAGSVAKAPSSLAASDPRETWPPHRVGDRPRNTAAGISASRAPGDGRFVRRIRTPSASPVWMQQRATEATRTSVTKVPEKKEFQRGKLAVTGRCYSGDMFQF